MNTLYATTASALQNGKKVNTTVLRVATTTGAPTTGHLEVVASGGTAVLAYTAKKTTTTSCGTGTPTACFTGVTVVSGTNTWTVATTAAVRQPTTVHNVSVLPVSSVTGFQTTAGGKLTVGTTSGTAVLAYTSDSTAAATCGTASCYTGVTYVSGSGKIAKTKTVKQFNETTGTYTGTSPNSTLHATADTGFTTAGTLAVATTTGSAIVSYTGDSTTAATCGSAACFTGVTYKSGAKGIPNGTITQVSPTIGTYSASVLHATADTGFTTTGTLNVAVTTATGPGIAIVSYTGDSTTAATCGSAACFTGVTYKSGAKGIPTVTGAITQVSPTINTYAGSGVLHAAADTNFVTSGTEKALVNVTTHTLVHTTTTAKTVTVVGTGTALVSYTGVSTTAGTCGSAACFTGVTKVSGATGVPKVGGAITQYSPTIKTYTGTGVLHAATDANFVTSGKLNVAVTKTGIPGTAVVSYTGTSTTATTCGDTTDCFTGVTKVSGATGAPTVGGAISVFAATVKTDTGTGVLRATSVTGFTTAGKLNVAVTKTGAPGAAVVSYTGTSTTGTTCSSTACFTGVTKVSGATGAPEVGGTITQVSPTINTYTGTGVLHTTAITNFSSSGAATVAVTTHTLVYTTTTAKTVTVVGTGTANITYTGTSTTAGTCGSAACFTGVTKTGGATGVPKVGGAVVQTAATIKTYKGGASPVLRATSITGFASTGQVSVAVTKTGTPGTAIVSYTGTSTTAGTCGAPACFTGATKVSGATGIPTLTGAIVQNDPTIATYTGTAQNILHASSITGFSSAGTLRVKVVTHSLVTVTSVLTTVVGTGTAVVSYTSDSSTAATCGSPACFIGVTYHSGAHGVPKLTGAISQIVPTVSTFNGGAASILHATAITGFTTTGTLTVTTSSGTVQVSYTGDSTTAATCGSAACFTGVTVKGGGIGLLSTGGTIKQPIPNVSSFTGAATPVLHASSVTGFTANGTITVATSAGTATATYTSTSTTAATCGSAACFKGVKLVSGTGTVTVTGAINQIPSTVKFFTGSGILNVAAVTGFHAPGVLKAKTSNNATAFLAYTTASGTSISGITLENNVTGGIASGTTVTETGPGGNGYSAFTTYSGVAQTVATIAASCAAATVTNNATSTNNSTSTSQSCSASLVVASASTAPALFTTAGGTLTVATSNGPVKLTFTGISGNTLTGVGAKVGSTGLISPDAVVVQTTPTAIKGALKVNGTAVSGWTWSVTVHNQSTFVVTWNGSSCIINTATPTPTSFTSCQHNAKELEGIDGTYIYVHYRLLVTSTGTVTVPGLGAIGAKAHYYDPSGLILAKTGGGSDAITTNATSAPGLSWTSVDPNGPIATLNTPSQGAAYAYGQHVTAVYSCSEPTAGKTITSCNGVEDAGTAFQKTVANGSPLTTSELVPNEIHTFTVTATNTEGYSSTQQSTFVALASPPVLANQTVTVASGGSVTVPFSYSGTYPVTHATEKIVSTPVHGTAAIQPTGKITYTNSKSAYATDGFEVSVSDTAKNPSNISFVHVHVTTTVPPTITVVTPPATGSGSYARHAAVDASYTCSAYVQVASCTASQVVTFVTTPVADGGAIDTTSLIVGNTHSLTVTAVSWSGVKTVKTVNYTVNTPHPVASNFTVKVASTGTVTVHALTHVTSTYPITPTTLTAVTLPTHGTATLTGSHAFKYTPKTFGTDVTRDSFTYEVKDIDGQLSNKGTVGVTIYAVPTISSISRASGSVSGGTQVTLTGTGFSTVTHVKFGTTTAAAITVKSPTKLVATSPAHAAGTVGISVTTPGGTTATTPADAFTFTVPVPVVSTISPTSGPAAGGTTVTVSGSGLTGATTVFFGTATGRTISVNAGGTQLTVKSPAGTSGASVAVRVKTPGGESAAVTGDLFTYGPTIASISPSSGPVAGGAQVTVTGAGFSTVTSVKFATTTAASYTVRSATQLVATSPAHAAGTARISVTTAAGMTPATGADLYKFVIPAPVVSAISPASGSDAGNTTVTVSGSALAGATTVFFGTSKGTTVSVNAGGTQLTVKSPSGTSGSSVNVRVVTPGGESAAVAADLFTYGPTITSVSPASGSTAGGTQVTVTGTGYSTVSSVKFGPTRLRQSR